jgi:hypothetical protein
MWLTIASWLLGSKIGRYIMVGSIFAAIVLLVMWHVYIKGKDHAELEQKLKRLNDLKTKVKVDEEIRDMSAADRRKQLSKWVRD